MPEAQTEDRRDLLASALVRMSSPRTSPNDQDVSFEHRMYDLISSDPSQDRPTTLLSIPRLEQRFVELLVPRVGIPLEIKVFARRGTIELGVLILGSYALLKDYKPLRESLELLVEDMRNTLRVPQDWNVALDIQTPGDSSTQPSGGSLGLRAVSRYGLLYLLIINSLALIYFGYLIANTVMANT